MRVLIVDDEVLARQRIRELLASDPEVAVVGECAFGEDAVTALQRDTPDLMFLDVRLPDLDGFGVLDRLTEDERPLVIFVTAFDEHAVKAFDVRALDYLVKPFERARLYDAVKRAKQTLASRETAPQAPRADPVPRTPGGRIAIRAEGRVLRLRLEEIERVEADRDISRFHLRGGTVLVARESLSSIENRLPRSIFLRVHRSHIVNVARVREVQPWFQGESVLLLEDGSQVVTGRTYRERVRMLLH
ncbi:MAG TPA: LytTR family DNA-binding domain-containing protein [Gemmatimonadales bacterium]|jgi:two-component system LytT family response regulator|nr:LytTR family DNA-binding domain-containing protein [Gemmatimonadales bacterium]